MPSRDIRGHAIVFRLRYIFFREKKLVDFNVVMFTHAASKFSQIDSRYMYMWLYNSTSIRNMVICRVLDFIACPSNMHFHGVITVFVECCWYQEVKTVRNMYDKGDYIYFSNYFRSLIQHYTFLPLVNLGWKSK